MTSQRSSGTAAEKALDLHRINLIRLQKLFGLVQIHTTGQKQIKQIGIDVATVAEAGQDLD